MKYKVKKVFNCQDMPEDIRKMFFEVSEAGNDCYVDYWIGDTQWEEGDKWGEKYIAIDKWLVENGAKPATEKKCGEEVLIKHWW